MKKRKLNQREKLFCDWYIKLANGTQAAIKAGYSARSARITASKLLTKANIQERLKERWRKLEEVMEFNKATLIDDLQTIKLMSMKAVPVLHYDPKLRKMVQVMEENDEGRMVGVYSYDSNGANRAIENINKMMGYNAPEKVEDITPLERKQPATVVINKIYADKKSDQPPAETNDSVGSA